MCCNSFYFVKNRIRILHFSKEAEKKEWLHQETANFNSNHLFKGVLLFGILAAPLFYLLKGEAFRFVTIFTICISIVMTASDAECQTSRAFKTSLSKFFAAFAKICTVPFVLHFNVFWRNAHVLNISSYKIIAFKGNKIT